MNSKSHLKHRTASRDAASAVMVSSTSAKLWLRVDTGIAPTSTDFDADYEGGLAPDVVSVLPSTDGRTVYILIRGQGRI